MPQDFVGTPFLAEFDRCAFKISVVLLQLALKSGKQRKRVGGGACKSGKNTVVIKTTDLFGARLHDGFAESNLTVAGECYMIALTNQQHCGAANDRSFSFHF